MCELIKIFKDFKIAHKIKQLKRSDERMEKLKLKLQVEKRVHDTLALEFFSIYK